MVTEGAPWLFGLVTAGWFWWMANQAKRTRTLWAVGGGAFGLVTSALLIGLGRARCISFSDHQESAAELKWAVWAAVVIVVGGWILTSGLHRHHLALWQKIKPRIITAETPASVSKPPISVPKTGSAKAQPTGQRQP